MSKKKELPKNAQRGSQKDQKAYELRDRHPERVLRRIAQSSGYAAARKYAEEHGLEGVLRRISLRLGPGPKQPRLVGRALRRHMKKLRRLQLEMQQKAKAQQP